MKLYMVLGISKEIYNVYGTLVSFVAAINLIRDGCELLFIKFLFIHKGTHFPLFHFHQIMNGLFSGIFSNFRQV